MHDPVPAGDVHAHDADDGHRIAVAIIDGIRQNVGDLLDVSVFGPIDGTPEHHERGSTYQFNVLVTVPVGAVHGDVPPTVDRPLPPDAGTMRSERP